MKVAAVLLLAIAAWCVAADLQAQEIARGEYLKFLPLSYPRLVQQSPATEELHVFGNREDPDYRDVSPVDGMDDRRHERVSRNDLTVGR